MRSPTSIFRFWRAGGLSGADSQHAPGAAELHTPAVRRGQDVALPDAGSDGFDGRLQHLLLEPGRPPDRLLFFGRLDDLDVVDEVGRVDEGRLWEALLQMLDHRMGHLTEADQPDSAARVTGQRLDDQRGVV